MKSKQELLNIGDGVQYTSSHIDKESDGTPWTWQGQVVSVSNKYATVSWTHSNRPVFGGPITRDENPKLRRLYRRIERNNNYQTGVYSIIATSVTEVSK